LRFQCLDAPPQPLFNHSVDNLSTSSIFNFMVEYNELDMVFHALGDTTRRSMLRELSGGERTVTQLAEPHAMSLAAASKHIKALESAGLIEREVRGRTHICRLSPRPLAEAYRWLSVYERFWNDRLDALAQALAAEDAARDKPQGEGEQT
jgi:DNA-binding transcriptional ArsR family regulator